MTVRKNTVSVFVCLKAFVFGKKWRPFSVDKDKTQVCSKFNDVIFHFVCWTDAEQVCSKPVFVSGARQGDQKTRDLQWFQQNTHTHMS